MRCASEPAPVSFTAGDNARLQELGRRKDRRVGDVLRSLDLIARGDYDALCTLESLVAVVRAEPHTEIPARYRLREASAPAAISGERAGSAGRRDGSPTVREESRNTEYERRVAARETPGAFRVPADRPLPLSYSAQCDLRAVSHERRSNSLHLTSGYAPLFSHEGRAAADGEPEPENPQLRFLRPEPDNPRQQSERRAAERAALLPRTDPDLKRRLNEPRMPELSRKVGKGFVPACAERETEATHQRCDGNDERMRAARAKVLAKENPMR